MCLNPLKGWIDPVKKTVVKVAKPDSIGARYSQENGWLSVYDKKDFRGLYTTECIDIPCRSCPECYAQSRREWITRAVAESQLHDSMIFLTLTYDDDKIPLAQMVDDDTGEILNHGTLRYKDFQDFMKRLRKYLGDKRIRFMVCGEYGSHTFRPHYHAIIYGVSLDDFGLSREHSMNSHGQILYTNECLERIWKNGYIIASAASVATIGYVAGYVAKKSSTVKPKYFYRTTGCIPPFIKSSNRPGLGVLWFENNSSKFCSINDYVSVATDSEPVKLYLTPRWREKFEDKEVYPHLDRCRGDDLYKNNKSDYYEDKVDRRVRLLDPIADNRKTDMSKADYNSSLNCNFRNRYIYNPAGVSFFSEQSLYTKNAKYLRLCFAF